MIEPGFDVVTGAFSYTGRFIARRLLEQGRRVRTLTNHPQRPGADDIQADVMPLQFVDRTALAASLRGADVLYNTYWVRFPHGSITFDTAVENTRTLVAAAEEAGVRKIVHISVSNPSLESPLPYYAGKARTEAVVQDSRLQWAVVRPTLVFGQGDVLINNIAYLLRQMPFFVIPGLGDYRVQPVAVEDVAEIATWAAAQAEHVAVDAAGPDILPYTELVDGVGIAIGRRPWLVHLPPSLTLLAGNALGQYLRDTILTREELQGLMAGLLVSNEEPPRGKRHVDDWLLTNARTLGTRYASELDRHFR